MKHLGKKRSFERMTINAFSCGCSCQCSCTCGCNCICNCGSQPYARYNIADGIGQQKHFGDINSYRSWIGSSAGQGQAYGMGNAIAQSAGPYGASC